MTNEPDWFDQDFKDWLAHYRERGRKHAAFGKKVKACIRHIKRNPEHFALASEEAEGLDDLRSAKFYAPDGRQFRIFFTFNFGIVEILRLVLASSGYVAKLKVAVKKS
ncbi:hypothetical protein ACFONN_10195 [Dyella humi]|uniref:Addiction module toxin RelE n=1 Tax=Dyella humi TaxID=1770547 RepID=A0ABW8IKX0_9GAMM